MIAAFAFLTILGRSATPDRTTTVWFGPVGLAVGAIVGGAWWGAAQLWSPLIAAGVAVAVDVIVTGMLHLDGLADSADGLLPPVDRDRRLAIMGQPDIGAFAVVVLIVVLGLRWASFAAIEPDIWLIAAVWCGSRGVMAACMAALPYARGQGLASSFGDRSPAAVGAFVALAIAAGVSIAAAKGQGLAAIAALVVASAVVAVFAKRRIGGYTGDVLGATGVVGETAALLAAASLI